MYNKNSRKISEGLHKRNKILEELKLQWYYENHSNRVEGTRASSSNPTKSEMVSDSKIIFVT